MSLRPTSVWRRTPLWLRLITTVLALSIVALTVMGVFGARLLRGYLVDRVDEQLVADASVTAEAFNEGRRGVVLFGSDYLAVQDQEWRHRPALAQPSSRPRTRPTVVRAGRRG